MSEVVARGELRPFRVVMELEEGETLTEDIDVIFTVKQNVWDPNESAVILKRLRSEPPALAVVQPHGPDPDGGEGNVAIVEGSILPSDTSGLFTGVRSRAKQLKFVMEAGIVYGDGAYESKEQSDLTVANTVYHY